MSAIDDKQAKEKLRNKRIEIQLSKEKKRDYSRITKQGATAAKQLFKALEKM